MLGVWHRRPTWFTDIDFRDPKDLRHLGTQPKPLVLWGKHDLSFDPGEPDRYRRDVPNAEVHVLDAGHFALDTKADEIAAIVRQCVSARVTEVQVSVAR